MEFTNDDRVKSYFVVLKEDDQGVLKRHQDVGSALAEAQRLCQKEHAAFRVCRAKYLVRPKAIEVECVQVDTQFPYTRVQEVGG